MLLPVLAAHMKRFMEIIRSSGMRGDCQISRKLLRKAISELGLHAKQMDVDALFEYLDPDGSGCIDFVDMVNALRDAKRKLWTPNATTQRTHVTALPGRHANGTPIQEVCSHFYSS